MRFLPTTRRFDFKPDYADAYYNRGNLKRALENVESALVDYDKAIELDPDKAVFYNDRGGTKSLLQAIRGCNFRLQ